MKKVPLSVVGNHQKYGTNIPTDKGPGHPAVKAAPPPIPFKKETQGP
jgi:hypothetical protein